ncbi:hypothetical protein I7X30_14220 [Capnocytophaga sp. 051621]|uniref:TonB C-terminal domain-containing protein n=2 Tax=Capnocytophaga TaxID=1016 RepID=A0ABS1YZY9_9FLAO|nr:MULTISPECIES: hypothetical protein [Capnocytophaga]MBI1648205.1 hypothetical protein [Capnocytophaga periodontitidis]MBM0651974.1 hypothetical protein [Capnocytophaga genosp. AHN8471]MBM0663385.1 hypothetical protein [Capnocytophaga genosp. AHN8471]
MKKLLFILCLFPLLMQAQDKKEAIMVLPDILIKGEVINEQRKNALIVTNYLNGSLLSKGCKTPAVFCKDLNEYKNSFKYLLYCLAHLKGYVRGCFFIEFIISKEGKVIVNYIEGFDYLIKERIESIFRWTKIVSPARNEKGDPIATKGFLLIHYDVQTLFPEDFEDIVITPSK